MASRSQAGAKRGVKIRRFTAATLSSKTTSAILSSKASP